MVVNNRGGADYAIEIRRPIGVFFHSDVRNDAVLIEPVQELTVAVSVIRRQCRG